MKELIRKTVKLWKPYHPDYDQVRYHSKMIRKELGVSRPKTRKRVPERLSAEEQKKLIGQAYKERPPRGLMLKTLFFTGSRVSEFVAIRAEDFFPEEAEIYLRNAKGKKSRYVPILPELAQELVTHLKGRRRGHFFETNRHGPYSTRMIQIIVKECAHNAGISKRVYPHLLRHTVATDLLSRGMPIDQIKKFLGHEKIETTQIYAETSIEAMKEGYLRAFEQRKNPSRF